MVRTNRGSMAIKHVEPGEVQIKVPVTEENYAMLFFREKGYDVGTDAYYDDPDRYVTFILRPKGRDPLKLFRPEHGLPNMRVFLHELNPNYAQSVVEEVQNLYPGVAFRVIYIPSNFKDLDMGGRYFEEISFPFRDEKGLIEYEEGPPRGMWNGVELIIDSGEGYYRINGVVPGPIEIYDHGIFQGVIIPPNKKIDMIYPD